MEGSAGPVSLTLPSVRSALLFSRNNPFRWQHFHHRINQVPLDHLTWDQSHMCHGMWQEDFVCRWAQPHMHHGRWWENFGVGGVSFTHVMVYDVRTDDWIQVSGDTWHSACLGWWPKSPGSFLLSYGKKRERKWEDYGEIHDWIYRPIASAYALPHYLCDFSHSDSLELYPVVAQPVKAAAFRNELLA